MLSPQLVIRGPFETALAEREVASPGPHEVLLATRVSLISPGTELAFYTGTHIGLADPANVWAKYPFKPGYAAGGVVAALGDEVHDLKIGDRVFTVAPHAGHHLVTPSPLNFCLPVPEGLPLEHAVFARLAAIAMTALLVSELDNGGLDNAATVGVIGLGLIGNFAAQLFAARGLRVVGVDAVPERAAWARECGLHAAVGESPAATLKEMLGEADVVIEATGVPALVGAALLAARERGQVILLGSPRGTAELDVYRHIHSRGVRLTGAHEMFQGKYGFPDRASVTRDVLHKIAAGQVRVAPLLTHRLSAARAGDAYEMLLRDKDKALGVVLEW